MKKLITSTSSYCFALKMVLTLLLGLYFSEVSAQCTGCTSTISTNTASVSVNSGQVVCITYNGTFNQTINFNGGTLCIGPSTTFNSSITINSGCTLNVYGKVTGSVSSNGGSITVYSGGTFSPSSYSVNGGSLTNNAGGTVTIASNITFPSAYTLTNYGAFSIPGFTVSSGATVILTGTSQTFSGSISNNGTLTIAGPATINGSLSENSGATTNLSGGITVTGSVSNNGTINLAGSLTVGGSISSNTGASFNANNGTNCNAISVGGTISGNGTFNGNNYNMTISPTPSCCMTNGASGGSTAPSQQPTSLSLSLSGSTVTGSFTSPSASISGYIVLRYVGTSAPSDNPTNSTSYSVGSTIGSCTVVAIIASSSTGTKTFTDNLPANSCGKNAYYRVFSYNGSGACALFDLSSPLTGSIAIASITASITPSGPSSFCGSGTLTASGGSTYHWNATGGSATTAAITASASGTYTVTVTSASGCTASASNVVTVNSIPTATITPSGPSTFCGSGTLTASGGGTYLWNATGGSATTAAITASASGTYTVTVTSAQNCTASASTVVTVNPIPTAAISPTGPSAFCGSGTLTASGGGTYHWNTTGGSATTAAITASASGTYIVTVTSASGCTASASNVVTVNPIPSAPTSVTATNVCVGGTAQLNANSSGNNIRWWTASTGGTMLGTSVGGANYGVTPASTTTYYAESYTSAGCASATRVAVTVTVNAFPTPAIFASGPTTFCTPGSVTLTASGGTSYSWSTGATTAAITATTSGNYNVTVTNASGCTATASQSVTANTVSAITPYMIAGGGWQNISTATVCSGTYVEFGPQPTTGTWTWTGPSGFHSYQRDTAISNVAAAQGGTYTATYVDGNGCTNTQTFNLTVNSISPTVNSPTVCSGTSATLTATGGGTYSWNTGATTASITTTSSGTYYVTVTGSNTCTATASGTVTVNPLPSTAISVTAACSGASSILTASGGNTYLWSTGATTASISSNSNTSYTVTATLSSCTASATASSIIYPNPTLSLTSNTPVCVGGTIDLTATPSGSASYTYSWSGVSSFTSTSASPTIANAISANGGSYSVTVTDNNLCSVTGTETISINANCVDSTTVGANGGNSSDAPCTQILRFDHYNDAVASSGGQNHTWVLNNGNILTMTITRTAGAFTAVTAPTWGGAAFGQSGYTGLSGKTVLYTNNAGYSKLVFSNIQMKDSLGNIIPNFTLIGIDGESTDNAERDTLTSNGTSWFDYDTITPPSVGSVPSETGIGTNMLIWAGTGPVNARARLVSTDNPTNFTFSTIAGGLQGFAMGISNPVLAPTTLTICSNSSFNATPTNLPAGTTYTWSTPVVSPAGSLTGAVAQNSPIAVVGQTLVNTTSSPATAVYSILPSNNCSGLGYTVTVTVNPSPSATVTSNAPICAASNLTVSATPVSGGTLTYSWSGPNSYTSTSSSFTISSATSANSGTYTVTVTGSNTCTASVSNAISVYNCLTVSGGVFDDGGGNRHSRLYPGNNELWTNDVRHNCRHEWYSDFYKLCSIQWHLYT